MPQDATFPKIGPRKETAVRSLVSGVTISETARALGLHRTTVHRWLRDIDFQDALDAARAEMAEAARGRLQTLAAAAIDAIRDALMKGKNMTVRSRTAVELLRGIGLLENRHRVEEATASPDWSKMSTTELLARRAELVQKLAEFGVPIEALSASNPYAAEPKR